MLFSDISLWDHTHTRETMSIYVEPPAAIVFDCGSSTVRIGVAGDDVPSEIWRNPVKCFHAGDRNYSPTTATSCVPEDVPDQDELIALFARGLAACGAGNDRPVLLADSPCASDRKREEAIQALFEGVDAPAAYIALQTVLATYASGRGCALAIGVGESCMQITPVYEGYSVVNSIQKVNFGGRHVTSSLRDLICSSNTTEAQSLFAGDNGFDLARRIKESYAYVSSDYRGERRHVQSSGPHREYVLPDGRTLLCGHELFTSSEALFSPELFALEQRSVQQLVYDAVAECDIDIRRDLLNNVFPFGGATLTRGFTARLTDELQALVPFHRRVRLKYAHSSFVDQV
jgi:actin-related protein